MPVGVLTVPVNGDADCICNCMEVKGMIDVMRASPHAEFIHLGTWTVNGAGVRFQNAASFSYVGVRGQHPRFIPRKDPTEIY